MKKLTCCIAAFAISFAASDAFAQRTETTLNEGWQFSRGELSDVKEWQNVRVPHDWAVYGPFDGSNDLQKVMVEQDGEKEKSLKTGRTGGLPFIGKGVYRRTLEIPDTAGRQFTLVFDGAMSNAHVKINGKEVGFWPYGYNSFYVELDNNDLRLGENVLTVELENYERASRWYPGAGLYRNVHLVETGKVHIPIWGTYVTTPYVTPELASVTLRTKIEGAKQSKDWPFGEKIVVNTNIYSPQGKIVASGKTDFVARGQELTQNFSVKNPELWDLDSPALYTAKTTLTLDGKVVDEYDTRFGIRKIEYIPDEGFFLNGKYTKFKGVCNHHDLGPLGAAVNKSALRHQIELMKEIGVNAIRTSHNMPAPELVELCDEMGIMLMVEPFDDWGYRPKSPNGYGAVFNEWAERDITNMVEQYRNSPSVVMWSIGNEVPSQGGEPGMRELVMLQDLVHKLDPTRPVTCGMDQALSVLDNGFAAALDIPGFNYKPHLYKSAYERLPQKLILGSETASTVSSRGVYKFPMEVSSTKTYDDHQCSSYDTEFCYWSNIPDLDFAADEDYPWCIGQFVWTGFDYLGEPTPYATDGWPSHSSMFGIFDLASLPKDRAYLYRSVWREDAPTLHILPHWNWKGREGQQTPVMVYTSYPKAELFVNGVNQGIREKEEGKKIMPTDKTDQNHFPDKTTRESMNRYRLIWDDVVYQPGEIKVVAYDENGNAAEEKTVKTAGKPHHLVLTPNREELAANGDDLLYVTVQVADKDGNIVPTDTRMVKFKVEGAGSYEAAANGDPTCLLPFQNPEMKLFSGAATAIARSAKEPGALTFTATAPGVKTATLTLPVK
ncbi:MAG: DUF4982 domain-containing protein [Clostridium sp.]|nr:DUF4982 domain-containing protein [Clostridium sp.]